MNEVKNYSHLAPTSEIPWVHEKLGHDTQQTGMGNLNIIKFRKRKRNRARGNPFGALRQWLLPNI